MTVKEIQLDKLTVLNRSRVLAINFATKQIFAFDMHRHGVIIPWLIEMYSYMKEEGDVNT